MFVLYWYECPAVGLACETLHVSTVCIWCCERAKFCVDLIFEFFYALYINVHSFIHSCLPNSIKRRSNDQWHGNTHIIITHNSNRLIKISVAILLMLG